jgi:transcriptional regulator with XRE-family HTH domain
VEQKSEGPPTTSEVPGRHITVNQLIGYNMARWRKAAKFRQQEIGDAIGWSKATVSGAERSWAGKRERKFTADDLIGIAQAIGIPVAALFLPPDDDGASVRYLFRVGSEPGCREMGDLFSLLIPEAQVEEPHGTEWREAFKGAVARYLDRERGAELMSLLEDMASAERRAARMERIKYQREAALGWISDLDQMRLAIEAEERS